MADETSNTPDTNAVPASAAPAPDAAVQPVAATPEAPSAVVKEQQAKPKRELSDKFPWHWGTGRRKAAVARVRMRAGTGKFKIQVARASKKNGEKAFKTIEEYFSEDRDRTDVVAPLKETNTFGSVDVFVRVTGGGYMGQAGAIVLGVARALKKYDETLEPVLRDKGFLSRDPRKVERKKYGQRGARRRFQFSKR